MFARQLGAALLFGAAVFALPSAHADDKVLADIPLAWKPSDKSPLDAGNAGQLRQTAVRVAPFRDLRRDRALIGENREKMPARQVTTQDPLGPFLATQVGQVLAASGFNVTETGGQVVLSGDVKEFFVDETNRYRGRAVIHFVARNSRGKPLWSRTITGHAEHFGRSYKADNYYEALSDSVVDALKQLVQDRGFRNALRRR